MISFLMGTTIIFKKQFTMCKLQINYYVIVKPKLSRKIENVNFFDNSKGLDFNKNLSISHRNCQII